MVEPIWKDKVVRLGANDTEAYIIKCNGDVIYNGIAVKRPGATTNEIKINNICADYLSIDLPDAVGGLTKAGSVASFRVEGTLAVADVDFAMDWSYDKTFRHNPAGKETIFYSDPVRKVLDARQVLLMSVYVSSGNIGMDWDNGEGYFEESYLFPENGMATLALNLEDFENIQSLALEYQDKWSFDVVRDECADYCLYYINAYGGWDSLLVNGRTIRTDNYSRKQFSREYENSGGAFGKVNYVNEITRKFTFNTNWLFKDEGQRMHHLIGSNKVYAYDLRTKEIIPLNITDTSYKYKTYANEGGNLVQYQINADVAQEFQRR